MTDKEILDLASNWLEVDDGRDYYAYHIEEHYWGEPQQIVDFAKAVIDLWRSRND